MSKHMFNALDELLSQKVTDDSWYDDGFSLAQDILTSFSPADWHTLSETILSKDIRYQKKLVYCLDGEYPESELSIIEKCLSVKDKELSEMCIDSLRCFDTNILKIWIKKYPSVIGDLNFQIQNTDVIYQKIIRCFLDKLNP